jgi:hypothetical protein
MNFPITHPIWMWLYFGAFGTAGVILFTLVIWYAMKGRSPAHIRYPGIYNVYYATIASMLSIFSSVPGWICLLVSQRLLIRSANKN